MGRRPVAGIMGAADAAPVHERDAERLGELLAQQGWIVLTGGRPFGVMEAAMRGAKRVRGSLTIGVLPTADETPSSFVDVAIRTDLGHGRNNVTSCRATSYSPAASRVQVLRPRWHWRSRTSAL